MKCLEIISVRMASPFIVGQACQYLKEFCQTVKGPLLEKANFYINSSISGDIAVMLSWQDRESEGMKSNVGHSLADALKQFGPVEHICWIMMEAQ